MWKCGNVEVSYNGSLAMWKSGSVEVWKCGSVEVSQNGSVEVWKCDRVWDKGPGNENEFHSFTVVFNRNINI